MAQEKELPFELAEGEVVEKEFASDYWEKILFAYSQVRGRYYFTNQRLILVFDAYKVKGNPGSVEKRGGIYVVYTKEAETADSYIEKTTYEIAGEHFVRVVTSDMQEQYVILGNGAYRVSPKEFRAELDVVLADISELSKSSPK